MSSVPAPFEVDLAAILALPEAERVEELARVQVLQRVLASNPLWRFLPHEGEAGWKRENGVPLTGSESRGQVEYLEHFWVWLVAAVAGNRFGKTHIGVADALIQTLPVELVPPWLLPFKKLDPVEREIQMRFVGVDLANWLAKAMIPKCRKLIPPQALYKGEFDKAYNDRERKLRFADGSWWDFLTHDMDLDSFASADLDRVTFDEEPPGQMGYQQFEESVGRLIDRDGDMRFTLTPLLGLTWLYAELSADDKPRQDDEVWVVTGSLDHNPYLSAKGRERAIATWRKKDPLRADARQHGKWVHFEGLIYPEFSEEMHVVPDRPLPRASQADGKGRLLVVPYASIDPGINEEHKMALIMGWLDDQDVLEVFHTHKFADGTAGDMASHFHAVCAAEDFRTRWNVIDPSAQNRNAQTGRSMQWEFMQQGVPTIPGQNARIAGFNAVKERLKGRAPDGRPKLIVHASCSDLIHELRNYRWKKPKGRSDDAPRAEPIKKDDDLVDALRYLVMSLPTAPRPREEDDMPRGGPERVVREQIKRLSRRKRRGRIGGVV